MRPSIKSLVKTATCLTSLLMAGSAYAATMPSDNWYAGISGDATWLRHSDMGWGGNVAVGYRFWPSNAGDWRLEGEVGYHAADGSDGYSDTHYITYMGNIYYDFNFGMPVGGWTFKPYLGAGVGDAAVHFGNSSLAGTFHHNKDYFAYQGMAGLNFVAASMPNTDWSLGYRYLGTDNHNVHANNVELGVRFHF